MVACALLALNMSVYPRAFIVTELDKAKDVVTVVDSVGYEWEFYGTEDYEKGDLVVAIMSDNGTPENIFDDYFMNIRYGGFNFEE